MRKRYPKIQAVFILLLFSLFKVAQAIPVLANSNYQIEQFVSGAGAVDGMAFNNSGELFFTDYSGGRVLKVTQPYSAGVNAFEVYSTGILYPTDLAFNSENRLFVSSSTSSNSSIIEVQSDGSLATFSTGYSYPTSIDSFGSDLFVSNSGSGTISKISSSGVSSTFLSSLNNPYGIDINQTGDLYFAEHSTGNIYSSTQAGDVTLLNTISSSFGATFVAYSPNGDLFISDSAIGSVFRLDSVSNELSLFASGFSAKSNPPFIGPTDLVFDNAGNLYVGDGSSIWKVSAVPVPPAIWLFLSGLVGLFGKKLLTNIGFQKGDV